MSMTVTGTTRLFSSQTWVMPSLVPSRPFTFLVVADTVTSELDLDVNIGRKVEPHERIDSLRRRVNDVDETLMGAHFEVLAAVLVLVGGTDDTHHVLLCRKRHRADDGRTRAGHRADDLACRAFRSEVLAAVLVLVGGTDDTHHVLLCRKRHRADDGRTRAGHRVDDLACRAVDDLMVIRLQSNADLLSRHVELSLWSSVVPLPRALDAV